MGFDEKLGSPLGPCPELYSLSFSLFLPFFAPFLSDVLSMISLSPETRMIEPVF